MLIVLPRWHTRGVRKSSGGGTRTGLAECSPADCVAKSRHSMLQYIRPLFDHLVRFARIVLADGRLDYSHALTVIEF